MVPTNVPPFPSSGDRPVPDETSIADLDVEGALPAGLSGRLLRIGPNPIGVDAERVDGMVHAVHLHGGHAVSYRNRWITTDSTARKLGVEPMPGPRRPGQETVATNLIRFGRSTFALGDSSLAYELTPTLETVRRVDLAGRSRGLAPYPKLDPITGELHLLAGRTTQAHVTVSRGALTRTNRPIVEPPAHVTDLAVTRTHLVVAAAGFVGLTTRADDAESTWSATGVGPPRLLEVHDDGKSVIAYVLTPALERWTLQRGNATVDRTLLDPTPYTFARSNEQLLDTAPRYLWSVTDGAAHKHDVLTGRRDTHDFEPGHQPGDLVFVTDPTRSNDEDGGWLIGFLHHDQGNETDLVVLDAADLTSPGVATVRIPRRVPKGRHALWSPTTLHSA